MYKEKNGTLYHGLSAGKNVFSAIRGPTKDFSPKTPPRICRIFLPNTVGKKGPLSVRFRCIYTQPPVRTFLFLSPRGPLPGTVRRPKRARGALPQGISTPQQT